MHSGNKGDTKKHWHYKWNACGNKRDKIKTVESIWEHLIKLLFWTIELLNLLPDFLTLTVEAIFNQSVSLDDSLWLSYIHIVARVCMLLGNMIVNQPSVYITTRVLLSSSYNPRSIKCWVPSFFSFKFSSIWSILN